MTVVVAPATVRVRTTVDVNMLVEVHPGTVIVETTVAGDVPVPNEPMLVTIGPGTVTVEAVGPNVGSVVIFSVTVMILP